MVFNTLRINPSASFWLFFFCLRYSGIRSSCGKFAKVSKFDKFGENGNILRIEVGVHSISL